MKLLMKKTRNKRIRFNFLSKLLIIPIVISKFNYNGILHAAACLLFIFISPINSFAQTNELDLLSIESRTKFGNYLFCSGDYIRAIDEFKEVLRKEENDTVRFKTALSLRELEHYTEAEDYFKALYFESNLADEAMLEYYKSLYFSENFKGLREELRTSPFYPGKYESEVMKLRNITYLYPDQNLIDSTSFFKPFNGTESIELLKFYMRKKYPDRKSPTTAALLSAIVPGLGKIYTEEYTDGLTAFLFTGVLTFLSVDNFNSNHDFRGWLFAGLAAYFYAGNVYGSAASAQIYNAGVQFNFRNDLKIFLNKNNHFMPKYNFLCD